MTGDPVKITGGLAVRKGAWGPSLLPMFLSFPVVSSIVQIDPFRPGPSHSATDGLSDLVQIFLAGPPLLGSFERTFFFFPHQDQNPLSALVISEGGMKEGLLYLDPMGL